MRASDQTANHIPLNAPTTPGATYTPAEASRAVYITEGVTEIQGPTKLEYVPYQRTVLQYEPVQTIQYIPIEKKVIQYEERKRIQQVPIQQTVKDYYTVEHVTEYVPQLIPDKKIEFVPVEKIQNRVEYYPIERQVVYYPNQRHHQYSRTNFHPSHLSMQYTLNPSFVTPNQHQAYFQRTQTIVRTDKLDSYQSYQVKEHSYVSPLDFTRQNISPRVSGVSLTSSSAQHNQTGVHSETSSKKKSKHGKKHHKSHFAHH